MAVKGIRQDPSKHLVGIEIETGWTSEAKRKAFFADLEKAGYGELCISKHDGTIGDLRGAKTVLPAEIVTAPMSFDAARKFMSAAGKIIESRADRGLITTGCGVHIHMSEGMFPTNVLWRYAAAICQQSEYIALWLNRPSTVADVAASTTLNAYWDAICLRGETSHSRRSPYSRVADIPQTRDHARAFIHGRHTPTFETRIFRTPKSRRVLASYLDAVESLLAFSSEAAGNLLEEVRPGSSPDLIESLKRVRIAPLVLSPSGPRGERVLFDPVTGEQYSVADSADEYRRVRSRGSGNGYQYYPAERFVPAGKRILTDAEEAIITNPQQGTGARGWAAGTIPLREYLNWVINHGDQYPDLARRLGFDKFTPFVTGRPPEIEKFTHCETEHSDFRRGCRVRLESGKGEIYTLRSNTCSHPIDHWDVIPPPGAAVPTIIRTDGGRTRPLTSSGGDGAAWRFPVNQLIHACPGATDAGGEI